MSEIILDNTYDEVIDIIGNIQDYKGVTLTIKDRLDNCEDCNYSGEDRDFYIQYSFVRDNRRPTYFNFGIELYGTAINPFSFLFETIHQGKESKYCVINYMRVMVSKLYEKDFKFYIELNKENEYLNIQCEL